MVKVLSLGKHNFSLASMMGRDGFLKMRSMILGHDPMGGNMFRGVGHGGHRLYHGNPAGTRGNKLYRMMMGSYGKIVRRVIWRERLYWPHRGFRPDKLRLVGGLIASALSLGSAHRHAPSAPADGELQIINERGSACVKGPAATPKPSAVMSSADSTDSRKGEEGSGI